VGTELTKVDDGIAPWRYCPTRVTHSLPFFGSVLFWCTFMGQINTTSHLDLCNRLELNHFIGPACFDALWN
jgi:hypothetical protein